MTLFKTTNLNYYSDRFILVNRFADRSANIMIIKSIINQMIKQISRVLFIVGAIFLANIPNITAQTHPKDLLQKVCNVLKGQKSLAFELDITYDNILDTGEKIQYSGYQKVWLQRPNKLVASFVGDERSNRFYYDGRNFTLLDTDQNFYSTKPALANVDDTMRLIEQQYGISIPLSNVVISDPCAIVKSDIQTSLYVGLDMVKRVPAHHLLLVKPDRDIQLWISNDNRFVLLKAVITYKNLPQAPQYTAIFSNWVFNPKIAPNMFKFNPPANARSIDILPIKTP